MEKKATREKLVVLSVNWKQSREQFREIKRIFEEMHTEVTLISDEIGRAGDAYGVKGIPHMVIVGKDGKIVVIHIGYSEARMTGPIAAECALQYSCISVVLKKNTVGSELPPHSSTGAVGVQVRTSTPQPPPVTRMPRSRAVSVRRKPW